MSDETYVCRECGSERLIAHYKVWERQDVSVYNHPEHGLQVNYEGCTQSGDAEGDEEYWCAGCDTNVPADRLDELVVTQAQFDLSHVEDIAHSNLSALGATVVELLRSGVPDETIQRTVDAAFAENPQ